MPREYWIHDGFAWYTDPKLLDNPDTPVDDFVHVIEKSAYDELKDKLLVEMSHIIGGRKVLKAKADRLAEAIENILEGKTIHASQLRKNLADYRGKDGQAD